MAIRKLLPVRAHSCGDLQQRIARAFACVAVVAALSALPSRGLAQEAVREGGASIEASADAPSSVTHVGSATNRAEALRLKRKKFIITGSVLLPVGLTCVALAAPAGNQAESLRSAFARGLGLGLGGFVASIAGIALLGRSRGLKKEREKLLQPTIGIGYVGVRGRF